MLISKLFNPLKKDLIPWYCQTYLPISLSVFDYFLMSGLKGLIYMYVHVCFHLCSVLSCYICMFYMYIVLIYKCRCIYIYIYIYIYMFLCICIFVCVYIYVYIYVCATVLIYPCVYVCVGANF